MALITQGSRCAICHELLRGRGLDPDRPFTATSGCAFASTHRLFRFCDAPLHLDCLAAWPDRVEFSLAYFHGSLEGYRSGSGSLLYASTSWFLACGPIVEQASTIQARMAWHVGEPVFAEVRLAEWPFRLYSKWRQWDAALSGGFRQDLTGPALDAANQVISEVRLVAPTHELLTRLLHQEPRGH